MTNTSMVRRGFRNDKTPAILAHPKRLVAHQAYKNYTRPSFDSTNQWIATNQYS